MNKERYSRCRLQNIQSQTLPQNPNSDFLCHINITPLNFLSPFKSFSLTLSLSSVRHSNIHFIASSL
ncbi:hypothetical protein RJT34_05218 [Clitoria ternatea]|uniref:Uncharacterized protein n=1 Tax=Clitoria ternatea TaxID=43366 RepID=A0AAN9K2F8_CLITE